LFHVPPRLDGASRTVSTGPPNTSSFFSSSRRRTRTDSLHPPYRLELLLRRTQFVSPEGILPRGFQIRDHSNRLPVRSDRDVARRKRHRRIELRRALCWFGVSPPNRKGNQGKHRGPSNEPRYLFSAFAALPRSAILASCPTLSPTQFSSPARSLALCQRSSGSFQRHFLIA
jgi:hypothetical protein